AGGWQMTVPDGPLLIRFDGDLTERLDWLSAHLSLAELQEVQAALGPEETDGPLALLALSGHLRPLPRLLARRQGERLVRLLAPGALVSYLQPLIRLADGAVFGYEALVRSRRSGAVVLPGELWTLARAAGLVGHLER